MSKSQSRALPKGVCWCGCGAEVPSQSFWVPGYDKFAESWVITAEYGSVADFLNADGFGPGARNTREEYAQSEGRRA